MVVKLMVIDNLYTNNRFEIIKLVNYSNDNYEDYVMLLYFNAFIDEPARFIMDIRSIEPRVNIQIVNTDNIVGKEHIIEIIKQTIEAKRRGVLLANKVEVDIILRLACVDQIEKAIEILGLKHGMNNATIIALGSYDILMQLGNRLNAIIDSINASSKRNDYHKHDDDNNNGSNDFSKYEHILKLHSIDKDELYSCVLTTCNGSIREAIVSILAERANLLYR
jgi:tRNA threonylcarbamoyladenosine modification (KEOPS) complex Cgi121 subunit